MSVLCVVKLLCVSAEHLGMSVLLFIQKAKKDYVFYYSGGGGQVISFSSI